MKSCWGYRYIKCSLIHICPSMSSFNNGNPRDVRRFPRCSSSAYAVGWRPEIENWSLAQGWHAHAHAQVTTVALNVALYHRTKNTYIYTLIHAYMRMCAGSVFTFFKWEKEGSDIHGFYREVGGPFSWPSYS
jgi:hypothetical protein